MSDDKRATFGSKLSVILVSAGSAIGLGAIWRFPYIAGKHGGAAFLLVFLLSVFVVGMPAMIAEFAVGRKTHKNAVGAYRALSKKWSWLGYSGVIGSLFISGYYYVIAGWSLEYLFSSATGALYSTQATFSQLFDSFQASYRPMIYAVIFILLTHIIVVRGVKNGIEKASRVMMPALFVILMIMAVRVLFMPNAIEGYRFFLSPDFEKAFSPDTIMMAIGQAFFSLSVGIGCMVTYASYFKQSNNLISTSFNVSILTLMVSLLAGLVIFPAVFSAGLEPAEGPSLIFITLPEIFKGIPLADLWSSVFFLLVTLASLTSTISFHEVLTAYLSEEFKITRKWAARLVSGVSIVLSILTLTVVFDFNILSTKVTSFIDIYDSVTANVIMPLGAMFTCIFVSWFMKRSFLKEQLSNNGKIKGIFVPIIIFMLRYVTPLFILYIFLQNLGVF